MNDQEKFVPQIETPKTPEGAVEIEKIMRKTLLKEI